MWTETQAAIANDGLFAIRAYALIWKENILVVSAIGVLATVATGAWKGVVRIMTKWNAEFGGTVDAGLNGRRSK